MFASGRSPLSPPLIAPGAQLVSLLVLSWAIAGTDLYLHATTKSINLNFTTTYYQDRRANSLADLRPKLATANGLVEPLREFGAELNSTFCPDGQPLKGEFDVVFAPQYSTCTVAGIDLSPNSTRNATDFKLGQSSNQIFNLQTVIEVYNNQSDLFRVNTVNKTLFLGPAGELGNVDFKASTVGITTQCESITNRCNFTSENLNISNDGSSLYRIFEHGQNLLTYNCSLPLKEVTNIPWVGYYTINLRSTEVVPFDNPPRFSSNSFSYGARIILDVQSPSIKTKKITVLQDDLVQFENGFWVTIQFCNSVVQDINYTYYSNTSSFEIDGRSPSNQILTDAARGPFAIDFSMLQAGVQHAAQIAVASQNSFLEAFATQLSRLVISYVSGAFMPRPSLSEAWWETRLITRIPKIPLMILEVLLFTYALCGLVLGIIALIAYRKAKGILATQKRREGIHDNDGAEFPLTEASTVEKLSPEAMQRRLTDVETLVVNELFEGSNEKSRLLAAIRHNGEKRILLMKD